MLRRFPSPFPGHCYTEKRRVLYLGNKADEVCELP